MLNKSLRLNIMQNNSGSEKYFSATILLGLVLILGFVLRFYDLGAESFWLDEVATTIEVQRSISEILTGGRLDQPPAYYFLINIWTQIFGISEISLRSFSALAGTGSIVLIYLVGRELFGKEVGLLGAFLMAISDFQISFSQEARNYSLFEFATLLSFLFFILFLGSKRKIHLTLYFVSSIFMVYTNAFGICVLAAQNLFLVFQIKRNGNVLGIWIIGQVLILLAIIPYFSPIIFGNSGLEGAVAQNLSGPHPSSFSEVLRSIYRFILPPRRYFGADMEWGNALIGSYAVAGAFLVTGTLIYAIRQRMANWLAALGKVVGDLVDGPDVKRNILLVSCWLLCPPLLLFVVSKIYMPVYAHRFVISAAPAFYLLLALGIIGMRKVVPLMISICVLMILIVPGLGLYYVSPTKEQWKETAAFIEANGGQNEVLVFAPNEISANTADQLKAFNYYYNGNLPSCGIGPEGLTDIEILEALKKCTTGHDRFWVIRRHTTVSSITSNQYETFFLNPNQTNMRLLEETQFFSISAYLFEWTE